MCNLKGNLVAWMDGELSSAESAAIEQHLATCAECGRRVSAYELASQDFVAHYTSVTESLADTVPLRRTPAWLPLGVAAAAAIVIALVLLPRKASEPQTVPRVATTTQEQPAVSVVSPAETPAKPVRLATRRRITPHPAAPQPSEAVLAEPTVRIAIPADAIYPPGAVPEGMAYLANVSFAADGSVRAFRLQR